MNMTFRITAAMVVLLAATSLYAQTSAAGGKLSGTVADSAGNPVAGATVEHWRYDGAFYQPDGMELKEQATTGPDGKFEFPASSDAGVLLAHKPGLAPAWNQVNESLLPAQKDHHLTLTPPGRLAGTVLDESNRPVAGAEVSVSAAYAQFSLPNGGQSFNYLAGKPAQTVFAAQVDAAGHFQIENFPTNTMALLNARAPGKVLRPPEEESFDLQTSGNRVGDLAIKLGLEPAGGLAGQVAGGEAGQPLPVARVSLVPEMPNGYRNMMLEPVFSGADGRFHFDTVAPGSYQMKVVFGTNNSAGWVAEAAPVSVTAGEVTRDVRIPVRHGALLEVSVVAATGHKPVAGVQVTAFHEQVQSLAKSDDQGVARLYLLPGDYQLNAFRQSWSPVQASATVAAGVTNRVEMEMPAPKKISGVVRNPDGQPAANVPVQLVGAGGFGLPAADLTTDASGKFELDWNQRQFNGANSTSCLLVRDVAHNLAVAQDVDEDTGALDLKLAPALTLAGSVTGEGRPLSNVVVQLVFWTGNSGSWLPGLGQTNAPGRYELLALPPGRKYGVVVSAPGYGQKQNNNLEVSAAPGRQELDPVELTPANLKLAGQVLDADDKPVAGCNVSINGDGQPNGNVRTDKEGRFAFAHVCAGAVRIFANGQNKFGNVLAEGGDTNVTVQLRGNSTTVSGSTAHKLKGVVTDDAGQPAANVQVMVFPSNNDRGVKTGTNGEYHLTWSLQQWQMQNGGAFLAARDAARNLAMVEELPEETTNLDLKLKPAFNVAGRVENAEHAPLPGAEVGLWFKAGNTYDSVDEHILPADAQGRYEIKCLPSDGQYIIYASANGYGRVQQPIVNEADTNQLELSPMVLKLADQVIAGQVMKADDQSAAGVNINLSGDGQPTGNMSTDSKGHFHFKVCEGQIRLFAYSQNGGGYGQATVEAGDTNIVVNLSANPSGVRQAPSRAALKGGPLPDLTAGNLAADAAPAGQAVVVCLFDAGQRPSRHVMQLLGQKASALQQLKVAVVAIQAAEISDDAFNSWKTAAAVSFPVGRVTEKSAKTKWTTNTGALPWLILADAGHHVVAEGFSVDELDAQVAKLAAK